MDATLSYNFDEIEYAVRQEIHSTAGRLNGALEQLRSQIAPLQQVWTREAAAPTTPSSCDGSKPSARSTRFCSTWAARCATVPPTSPTPIAARQGLGEVRRDHPGHGVAPIGG